MVVMRLFVNSLSLIDYEISDHDFRKLYVRWLKTKPECIQKLIVMEGDPLFRNINTVLKLSNTNS